MPLSDKALLESAELVDLLETDAPPEKGETHTLLPSASKTDLLMACTWPWGRRVRRQEVAEGARFGSAFHQVMDSQLRGQPVEHAAVAKVWGVDPAELSKRVGEAFPVIECWLRGENLWKADFLKDGIQTEVSVAYDYKTGRARFCDPPDPATHEYLDRGPNEIPGTADLFALPDKRALVVDHKSGWNVAADWQPQTPAESGQLRTLALALTTVHKAKDAIVAFFHAPAGGIPTVYADLLLASDLEAHRKALRQAHANIGSGWMRPGAWCAHCPAWTECPTQASALIDLKRGSGPLTAERVGAIHQATALYDNLRDRLRDEMRTWVKAHGPGVRPDGKSVELVAKEVTNLSQASVLRALGPLEGAKMIRRLTDLGCVEKSSRLELRATSR